MTFRRIPDPPAQQVDQSQRDAIVRLAGLPKGQRLDPLLQEVLDDLRRTYLVCCRCGWFWVPLRAYRYPKDRLPTPADFEGGGAKIRPRRCPNCMREWWKPFAFLTTEVYRTCRGRPVGLKIKGRRPQNGEDLYVKRRLRALVLRKIEILRQARERRILELPGESEQRLRAMLTNLKIPPRVPREGTKGVSVLTRR